MCQFADRYFIKMITRQLFSYCFFILLLVPAVSWALNESGDSPATQSEPATPASEKPAPALPAPVKPAPALTAPEKPAPVLTTPAKPAPVVIAPAKPAPVKPAPVVVAPVNPVPLTTPLQEPVIKRLPLRKPVPAKPAPAQSAPLQSPPLSQTHEPAPAIDVASQTIDIEVFEREDCLQCDKAKEFLTKLQNLRPQLKIIIRDVRKEPAALQLLKRMAQNQGGPELDYPAFVVGGQLIIGFSEEAGTARLILDTLAASHPTNPQAGKDTSNCETGKEPGCSLIPPAPVVKPHNVSFNIFGYSVQLMQIGLPLFTFAMGMLDGLNHGSVWVLILIISLLAPMKDRTAMFAIAGTFIAVQGLVYFILMAVWLNLLMQIEISRISQIAFGSVALLAGAIYLKKYLQFGLSLSISSHEITKPGIYTRIRKIVESENLVVALLGTTALAILVQLGEFTYTSVFPALYTRALILQHLDNLSNYCYLLLYDFAYMLDDIIVLTIGIVTLSPIRFKKNNGRILKLISGLVTMGLGAYMLLAVH